MKVNLLQNDSRLSYVFQDHIKCMCLSKSVLSNTVLAVLSLLSPVQCLDTLPILVQLLLRDGDYGWVWFWNCNTE